MGLGYFKKDMNDGEARQAHDATQPECFKLVLARRSVKAGGKVMRYDTQERGDMK